MKTATPQSLAFSERLRQAATGAGYVSTRSASGVDQARLAKRMRVTQEMIRRWLNGTAEPSPLVVRDLARALQVPVIWLLFGDC
jgi:transcriptional regulator with XRE-family HTH domain